MRRYAIIGHPVSHSLSPALHNAAFEALGLDCRYEAIDIEPGEVKERFAELCADGFAGFNVTVPHKQAVIPLLESIDETAKAIGAVNTIVKQGRGYKGYNTDVQGFLKLAEPFAALISGKHVCVLGAGGAARAVLYGLTKKFSPKHITVLNRTIDRAEAIAADFSSGPVLIKPESLFQDGLQKLVKDASVIINTTSAGMKPYTDATPLDGVKFRKDQAVIDLIYTPSETTLLKEAKKAGARAANGLEMWLAQAEEAFRLWTGKELPPGARKAIEEQTTG